MKKCIYAFITLSFTMGCFFNTHHSSYEKMNIDQLREEASSGNLEAQFWLGDRFIRGQEVEKNIEKAKYYWEFVFDSVEKDPAITNEEWFQIAYKRQHPMAIEMHILASMKTFHPASADEAQTMFQIIGKDLDLFVASIEDNKIYADFVKYEITNGPAMGTFAYMIATIQQQKYPSDAKKWASRACQLQSQEGCALLKKLE